MRLLSEANNHERRGTVITRKGLVGKEDPIMNQVIYLIGLVVVVLAVLSFFGLN